MTLDYVFESSVELGDWGGSGDRAHPLENCHPQTDGRDILGSFGYHPDLMVFSFWKYIYI